MRALVVALLLLAAGCAAPAPIEGAQTETPAEPVEGIVRLAADGSLLPVGQPLGAAWTRLSGHRGPEPNIGVTSSGAMFVSADDLVLKSLDMGRTWSAVYAFGLEGQGAPVDPISNADPMLWVDRATDRVYVDPMFPALACTTLAWSDDEGATWTERHGTCHPPPMDHQKLGGGPPSADAPPLAGQSYASVLYHCYNQGVATSCAQSYDGGTSFLPAQPVLDFARHGCGGLNGMPEVGPDGTVVVGVSEGCAGLYVAYSRDSGMTWSVSEGPKVGGTANDPALAFTPDGTLYALWADAEHVTHLARTRDLVAWEGPWRVTPPDVRSTVFWALEAGDEGRLAMAFLGTREEGGDPSFVSDAARWHLFVVVTEDAHTGSPTFLARQVTPDEAPVQIGCIWMGGFPGTPCRNLLDFIDAATHPDGTFVVGYTEGCTDGCDGEAEAGPDDSRDAQMAVAGLDGWSLRNATR